MKKLYKTALGRTVDIDQLRLINEETIAVGNMKVNARGDELGPGGEILRSRNQVMNDYYKLNTPVVSSSVPLVANESELIDSIQVAESERPEGLVKGSLAEQIASRRKNNQLPE